MKPHHAILIGFAIGLVLDALAVIYFDKPCPPIPDPTTTQGMLDRASQRDSIDIASALNARTGCSLRGMGCALRLRDNGPHGYRWPRFLLRSKHRQR